MERLGCSHQMDGLAMVLLLVARVSQQDCVRVGQMTVQGLCDVLGWRTDVEGGGRGGECLVQWVAGGVLAN